MYPPDQRSILVFEGLMSKPPRADFFAKTNSKQRASCLSLFFSVLGHAFVSFCWGSPRHVMHIPRIGNVTIENFVI